MTLLAPPRVNVSWTATALGASFGGYNVYRRPSRGVVSTWEKVAAISVPTGYTAATVEAQHTKFVDYEAGWAIAGGQWADGWDYAVTVVNSATTIESIIATIDTQNAVTPDTVHWLVSNAAPYLNFPIASATEITSGMEGTVRKYRAAGRDEYVTRTPLDLPGRIFKIGAQFFDRIGEDPLRYWRAANASGRAVALMLQRGDRCIGALDAPGNAEHGLVGVIQQSGDLIETSRASALADYNAPAGIVLNGTTQAITVPTNALIDPLAAAFTIVVVGAFANAAASRYALSKGNIAGAANGFALRTNGVANQLEFFLRGAAGNGAVTSTSAVWFDGNVHVAIAESTGTAQNLYQDDTAAAVATGAINTGSLTNAIALAIGADNAGASSFMALAPFQTVLYYPRILTAAEKLSTSRALLGYPGYRIAANANLAWDCRDQRTWNGTGTNLVDIAAIPPNLNGTLVATPATRGIPWPLVALEKF